jgi:hypothetical protein
MDVVSITPDLIRLKRPENRRELAAFCSINPVGGMPLSELLVAYICSVKELEIEKSEIIFGKIDLSEAQYLMDFERHKIANVIAMLWCQRELAQSSLSLWQRDQLSLIVDQLFPEKCFGVTPSSIENDETYELWTPPFAKKDIPRSLTLCFRKFWWANGESRLHDIGPRIGAAFNKSGWSVNHLDVSDILTALSGKRLHDRVLLIDVEQPEVLANDFRVLRELKSSGVTTIGWTGDYYRWSSADYNKLRDCVDIIWGGGPSSLGAELKNKKFTDFPPPVGIDVPDYALRDRLKGVGKTIFKGSIERNNLPRLIYWLHCSHKENVHFDITSHMMDCESPLDGYSKYLDQLNSGSAVLNLSERISGERPITGRSFEAMSFGSLLLQETCPIMSRYFVASEEFLTFSNPTELDEQLEKIKLKPKECLDIARNGHCRWKNNYANELIGRHFQALLDQ